MAESGRAKVKEVSYRRSKGGIVSTSIPVIGLVDHFNNNL